MPGPFPGPTLLPRNDGAESGKGPTWTTASGVCDKGGLALLSPTVDP